MDLAMLKSAQDRVKPDDYYLHLGDVTLMRKPWQLNPPHIASSLECIDALPGKKVLVAGNHDDKRIRKYYEEKGWIVKLRIHVGLLVLTHVPEPSHASFELNLHGHTHGEFKQKHKDLDPSKYIDVGVDAQNHVPHDVSEFIKDYQVDALREILNEFFSP
jgi:calcineurin-like phosphoesterase family protein